MNYELRKAFGLIFVAEFIFSQVLDGAWGVFFMWITFLFWEMWYLMVLGDTRAKAEAHYNDAIGRFKTSVGLFMGVETLFAVASIASILMPELLPAATLGIMRTIRFLILSVLFVAQISMLSSAIAATMSAEEYKKERGKILLYLILAPMGAIFMKQE